jgi:phosphomannomutase
MLVAPAPLPAITDAAGAYVARYVEAFGAQALPGARIGVYQHSAVGRDIVLAIVAALGAEAVPLGRSTRFVPVDTEAIRPEDVALAREWAAQHGFDAIISTDGDSDRPLLADHTGEWLRGDVLGVLCARALGAQTVVTPVSSNTVLERSGAFAHCARTRIGSPYVIEAMNAALAAGEGKVCGYEANGGFLLASDFGALRRCPRAMRCCPSWRCWWRRAGGRPICANCRRASPFPTGSRISPPSAARRSLPRCWRAMPRRSLRDSTGISAPSPGGSPRWT